MATYDRENKIWRGEVSAPPYNENESVGEVILQSLKNNAEKIVQISGDTSIQVTGNEMRLNSIRVAQNLTKLGYNKDGIVTIISRNHHNLAPLVFGCFFIGAPINALDISFDKNDIRHMLLITSSNLICCEPCTLDKVREILDELQLKTQIITLGELIIEGKSAENLLDGIGSETVFDTVHFENPSPTMSSSYSLSDTTGTAKCCDLTYMHIDDLLIETGIEEEFEIPQLANLDKTILAIICSSGTTGPPKGVILTHAQILGINTEYIKPSDTMLAFTSIYWISGLLFLIHGTLKGATRIITTSPSNVSLLLQLIQKYRVSYVFSPPNELTDLVTDAALETADLSSIKMWMCAGGSLDDFIRIKIDTYLKNGMVVPAYGMSELGSIVVSNKHNKEKSAGSLQPGVMAKIIDDTNKVLDNGTDGEICIRMMTPFMGYYHDETGTSDILDADGWMHTGDIGHFDDDGSLYITDRKTEILKFKSSPISPSDLEKLIEGISGVVMTCVVGIPDRLWGDLPAAVVVKSPNSSITTNSIIETVDAMVADHKKLRGGVYFVNELPLTPSGKIIRAKVKKMAIELYDSKRLM